MKTISIGSIPGTIQQVACNDGDTVAQIAAVAGLTTEGYEIRLNGAGATTSEHVPADGDRILLLRKVKGAAVTASVGKIPGTIQQVALDDGATIQDAINAAGLSIEGHEVRLNNEVITGLAAPVVDGSRILLLKKVKGA